MSFCRRVAGNSSRGAVAPMRTVMAVVILASAWLALLGPGLARAATPTVVVSPTSGSPGRGLTVTGSGWPAGDSIFVQIGSSTFDTDVVCVLTSSLDGTIAGTHSTGCQVPNVTAGSQPLVAIDEQHQAVTATGANFTVTPGFVLTPTGASAGSAASPGTTITIQGHGFAANSTVSTFKFDAAALSTSPTSVSTDPSGNFTGGVTFTVPSTTAGTHTVFGTDAAHNLGSSSLTIFTPTVVVSPTTGPPGTGLTVSGSGWPVGDSVFVQIGSSAFDTNVVCVLTSSEDGTIAGNQPGNGCQVPNTTAGNQQLVAIDEQRQGVRATGATFPLKSGLVLTPAGASAGSAASPGATVTIQGHGFAANSTVSTFKFDAAALSASPSSVSTDPSGNFSSGVTFTVPPTTAGTHTVSGTDLAANAGTASLTIFTPTLVVSPTSGPPGTGLTVTGTRWPAGDSIFVQIGSSTFDADVVCVLTASSAGTIAGNQPGNGCQVPNVTAGNQQLVAIDEQRQGVRAFGGNYPVAAGLVLTPAGASAGSAASPGATVTIQGHGFAANSTVSTFKFDSAALSTSPTSASTDPSGNFSGGVTFTVPSTTAGTHTVSGTDLAANVGHATVTVFTPTVVVAPTSGSPGRGLTVSGSGWPAGDSIFVQLGSTSFDTNVVCVLTASSAGTIAGNHPGNGCQVPNVTAGAQPLIAIDEQSQGVRATGSSFPVKAGLVLTPAGASAGSAASPGATVTMQGHGFAANSTVSTFKFDSAALSASPTSVTSDPSGNFSSSVTFTVPPTATAGTHTVSGKDLAANVGSSTLTIFTPTVVVSPTSGAPARGLTVSGSGWPAGDSIFVQIGSGTFDVDVVCVLTASDDGTIAGNQPGNSCQVPNVTTGSQPLVAIDEQSQGVRATGTNFTVT